MKVLVMNRKNNIEIEYENVRTVLTGFGGMFSLRFEDGTSATFHYADPEDGSFWECHY